MDSPDFWIVELPSVLGTDVAGLRTPDAATALLIDGFSTDNGKDFDHPPFGAGRADAIFMVFPAEVGERLYERLAAYVSGRQSQKENLADENEVLAAKWALSTGSVALLVADRGNGEHVQNAFERVLALEKIYLQRSDAAVIAPRFDGQKLLSDGRSIFSAVARDALLEIAISQKPAPPTPRRKPHA